MVTQSRIATQRRMATEGKLSRLGGRLLKVGDEGGRSGVGS
jgi:hypothetical protein